MKTSTHRHIQLAALMERASAERVRYYINASRAGWIGARNASILFTRKAMRWESIRQRAAARVFAASETGLGRT